MGGKAIGIRTLGQLLDLPAVEGAVPAPREAPQSSFSALDFSDVHGVPRETLDALADAARARKTVLLVGPPGCGKTMLAARCLGLLHDVALHEALETASIRDAAGLLSHENPVTLDRPFRAPHHTISPAGLVGGTMRPGEVNLAHGGVLLLDEVTEFTKQALEALRGALEDGETRVRRAVGPPVTIPARPWLILASNPCPCGNAGHPNLGPFTRVCACSREALVRHDVKLEQALRILRIGGEEIVTITLRPVPHPFPSLSSPGGATTAELRDAARSRAQAHAQEVLGQVGRDAATPGGS